MGMIHTHTCTSCGYSEQVSGGPDSGIDIGTDTYACSACQLIQDRTTWVEVRTDYGDYQGEPYIREPRIRCRKCQRKGAMKPWRSGDPCPRCGAPMPIDPKGINVLWD
ncbi:MAG: hypothetical protein KDN19_18955 [Verrucomicrobiae bacterium]|nr:hypothetical protein [Verrucomicrobiae bacterium]